VTGAIERRDANPTGPTRPVAAAVVWDLWRNAPGASEAALMVNIGRRPRWSRRLGGPANRNSL